MEAWQKILAAASGVAGVGALLYCLLKEDEEADAAIEAAAASSKKGAEMDIEELLVILKEMADSQNGIQAKLRVISKTMAEDKTLDNDFDKVYNMVSETTADPLEARGLTMQDVEAPLQRFQNDPRIGAVMQELLSPAPAQDASTPAKEITVAVIKEINEYQLEEADNFINKYQAMPDKKKYDNKNVIRVLQARMDSKVLQKFKIDSSELQVASMKHQEVLSQDDAFLQGHMAMQSKMEAFLSGGFA